MSISATLYGTPDDVNPFRQREWVFSPAQTEEVRESQARASWRNPSRAAYLSKLATNYRVGPECEIPSEYIHPEAVTICAPYGPTVTVNSREDGKLVSVTFKAGEECEQEGCTEPPDRLVGLDWDWDKKDKSPDPLFLEVSGRCGESSHTPSTYPAIPLCEKCAESRKPSSGYQHNLFGKWTRSRSVKPYCKEHRGAWSHAQSRAQGNTNWRVKEISSENPFG
ncbi:hypothetical protein P7C73_g4654, partial [Tremellales sp. Uapishka_1]